PARREAPRRARRRDPAPRAPRAAEGDLERAAGLGGARRRRAGAWRGGATRPAAGAVLAARARPRGDEAPEAFVDGDLHRLEHGERARRGERRARRVDRAALFRPARNGSAAAWARLSCSGTPRRRRATRAN